MITSVSNARVKEARSLQRKPRRYAAGRILIEGVRLVRDAFAGGCVPETVFYVPAQVEANAAAAALLRAVQAARVECVPVSPPVFASLAETLTPQGVAAVVAMPNLPVPSQPTLTLILDGIAEPGNAGTLLRSAEAAGTELALFGPASVDAFNDKALRAGMGAHFRLPLRQCAVWDAVWASLPPGQRIYVADAHAELAYDRVDWRVPSAVIVGSEANGPSDPARQVATPIAIPMPGRAESLNAAMAGTVILFEAARQRRTHDAERRA